MGEVLANKNDDKAIAPDKQALLPSEKAHFANYSSYVRGIIGNNSENALTNVFDVAGVRDNTRGSRTKARSDNRYDFNRDKMVNVFDFAIGRDYATDTQTALKLIDAPPVPSGSIHGLKWDDQNGNGQRDGNESGLERTQSICRVQACCASPWRRRFPSPMSNIGCFKLLATVSLANAQPLHLDWVRSKRRDDLPGPEPQRQAQQKRAQDFDHGRHPGDRLR